MNIDTMIDPAEERREFEAARTAVMMLGREQSRLDSIETVARLVSEADDLGAEGAEEIFNIVKALQKRRAFALMLVLCLLARQSGLGSPKLRQREVQALIELGRLEEAVRNARALAGATESAEPDDPETIEDYQLWATANGNIGRAYKQAYVNASRSPNEPPRPDPQDLKAAFETYFGVWERHPGPSTTYHAINAAALMMRGVRDEALGRPGDFSWVDRETARELAGEILRVHEEDLRGALSPGGGGGDVWTLATCGEAYLVLDLMDDAALCYGAYAGLSTADAFEIGSSLRQLQEVWQFDGRNRDAGGKLVRLLKTALINLQTASGGAPANDIQTDSVVLSPTEAGLIQRELEERSGAEAGGPDGYEAYFDKRGSTRTEGRIMDIQRISGALRRAQSICAIEALCDGEWQRMGTGFLVRGEALNAAWAGETLIVSNHHVVSQMDGALSSSYRRCRANFIEYDPVMQAERESPVLFEGVLWRSGERAHDVAVIRPRTELPRAALPLEPHDVSPYLPKRPHPGVDGTDMHVVILGFPGGGDLSFSYGDELLLDHDACDPGVAPDPDRTPEGRPVRLHYRTPSQPGSSGSPVFRAGDWSLVGVHHRGQPDCRRLAPRDGTYEANEGIWLPSIIAAIGKASLTADEGAPTPADPQSPDDTPQAPSPQGEWLTLPASAYGAVQGVFSDGAATQAPQAHEHGGAPAGGNTVFGRRIGPPPEPAAPSKLEIPGRAVVMPQDSPEIFHRHLRAGKFHGDLETFRLKTQGFETVIGDDNRTQIHETASDPFRMICSLTVHWPNMAPTAGTGFLIGQRILLTAGHCVLPGPGYPDPTAIEIRPGRAGPREPFAEDLGPVHAERISLHANWSNGFDPRFDVGAIHLNTAIGETLGWFRVGVRSPDELRRRWAHVTGYPGDKITPLASGEELYAAEQWHHATPISEVHDGRVYYPADTFAGQSGAPVYILEEDGRPTVVGIHAYGTGPNAGQLAMENNSAAWIDPAMLQVISDWRSIA